MNKVNEHNKKIKTGKKVIIIITILIIIITVIIGLYILISLDKIGNDNNIPILESSPEEFYPTTIEPEAVKLPKVSEEDFVTSRPIENLPTSNEKTEIEDDIEVFLIYGLDSRTPRLDGSRSDVNMFISVNWNTGKINIASIQRDILVDIPNKGINRINAAYSWGGVNLALETMKHNFHIEPDHVMVINFQGVVKAIDLIGGVEIDVKRNEVGSINRASSKIYGSGIRILDGEACLAYSRIRKTDNDFGRTQRQRNVIVSILNNKEDIELSEIISIINILPDYFYIDMNEVELIKLFTKILSLDIGEINQISIPLKDTYRYGNYKGMSILEIDFEENINKLYDHIYFK